MKEYQQSNIIQDPLQFFPLSVFQRTQHKSQLISVKDYPDWLVFKNTKKQNHEYEQFFRQKFKELLEHERSHFFEGFFQLFSKSFAGRNNLRAFEEFVQNVRQMRCKTIICHQKIQTFCLTNLIQIGMPNLTQLTITSQLITNIEALACLNAPKLKRLYLSCNRINSIKGLRKVQFRLKEVAVSRNFIIEPEYFCFLEGMEKQKYLGFCSEFQSPVFLAKVSRLSDRMFKRMRIQFSHNQIPEYLLDQSQLQLLENDSKNLIGTQLKLVNCLFRKRPEPEAGQFQRETEI